MRIVYFGTPAFAVPSLRALVKDGFEIAAVVTQPDRPRGRAHKLTPSEVKVAATELQLDVWHPDKLRNDEAHKRLKDLNADLGVVAAYGRILPAALLSVPRLGMINVHASLLPRWRGAAPVHRAILAGDRETGVTIMRVVAALDAGPMLARVRVDIGPHETSAILEARLATLGARLLVETVDRLAAGPVPEEPQQDADVTYANRLERSDSVVDWNRPAWDIHNQIRGLQPWPVATVMYRGRRL